MAFDLLYIMGRGLKGFTIHLYNFRSFQCPVSDDRLVQSLIERRMAANKWTEVSMTQYFRCHIDGEGENDGVSDKIAVANRALSNRFKIMVQSITSSDIQLHLDKAANNNPDWLAHLDVAFEMAKVNPKALETSQVKQLVAITQEPAVTQSVVSKAENIRPQYALRALEQLGLKAIA